MLQMPNLPFYQYSEDMYLFIPLIVGIVLVVILLYIKRNRRPLTIIYTSFIFSFTLSVVGITGSFFLSLWLKDDLGTGHVLFDGLYYGWNTSWYPMLISSVFIIVILMIAAKTLSDHKKLLHPPDSIV